MGKVCPEFHKLIHLRHVLSENIFPSISTFSIKPNFTMFLYTELYAEFAGDPPYVPIWEQNFLNDFFRQINKVILLMYLVDEFAYSLNFQMAALKFKKKLCMIFMVP